MSFDLPPAIEPEVIQYAQAEHITEHEAIERLIRAGLDVQAHQEKIPEEIIGAFPSPEAMQVVRREQAVRRGPRGPIRTDDDLSIMGLFANVDGFQESIDAVISSRAQRYGFSS